VNLGRFDRRHRWLLAAFVVAALATAFIGGRLVVRAVYWSQHQDEPIRGWMSVGYVARSYRVEREPLFDALGLPPEARDRRTLQEIAADQGRPLTEVEADLEAAIGRARASDASAP
jgi:hypothetical protein